VIFGFNPPALVRRMAAENRRRRNLFLAGSLPYILCHRLLVTDIVALQQFDDIARGHYYRQRWVARVPLDYAITAPLSNRQTGPPLILSLVSEGHQDIAGSRTPGKRGADQRDEKRPRGGFAVNSLILFGESHAEGGRAGHYDQSPAQSVRISLYLSLFWSEKGSHVTASSASFNLPAHCF
jgi:hypothetical protein